MTSPFKNLEQRYNDAVTRKDPAPLYDKAKKKFEGGRESTGKSDDPILTRAPGESQRGLKSETRETFVISAARDNERLKKYLIGPKGVKFLLKQQLLQTGNTFAFTRVINPLFVLGNTTPYVHLRRNLRPTSVSQVAGSLGGLIGGRVGSVISSVGGIANSLGLGKQSNDITSLRKNAQLQQETYDKLSSKGYGGNASGGLNLGKLIKKIVTDSPIGKTITSFTAKRSMGEVGDGWKQSRPELKTYIPDITEWYLKENQKKLLNIQYSNRTNPPTISGTNPGISFLKYFSTSGGIKSISKSSLNGENPVRAQVADKDGVPIRPFNDKRKIRYIFDPSNEIGNNIQSNRDLGIDNNIKRQYQGLSGKTDSKSMTFEDPVNLSFAIGKDNHIQFRAFLKDFTQTATPEYKSYQYIGRIEKFINYVGVQREISFKLSVIAFSKTELDGVWTKINYLTGMVFPYGFNRGIIQPNIVRLTIGDVFDDQPGYITSLNYIFDEISESWEIDMGSQLPISATMQIKFAIIEKNTKIATSPFYAITEGMQVFKQPLGQEPFEPLNTQDKTVLQNLKDNRTNISDKFGATVDFGAGGQERVQSNANNAARVFGRTNL